MSFLYHKHISFIPQSQKIEFNKPIEWRNSTSILTWFKDYAYSKKYFDINKTKMIRLHVLLYSCRRITRINFRRQGEKLYAFQLIVLKIFFF